MTHRDDTSCNRTRRTKAVIAAVAAFVVVAIGAAAPAAAHHTPWGQGESNPEDLSIRLATFSPGDEVAQWFGHTGLVVSDRRLNESWLYNYGMFQLDGALIPRFAMGRLEFYVAPTPAADTYGIYEAQDRDIRVVELNLPPDRRMKVAEYLADNAHPDNRYYMYHHYEDNCATRPRDVIDMAVDGQFSDEYRDRSDELTLREHTRRHTAHTPPMDWLLMFLMNRDIDEPTTEWEAMFLPAELENRVLEFEWVDDEGERRPLVMRKDHLYESQDRDSPPVDPPTHWPWWLVVGFGIGVVGLLVGWTSRRRPGRASRIRYGTYQLVVGLLLGLPGLMLGLMATLTEHAVTYWNQNLFWASPLTVGVAILAVFVLRGKLWARRRLVQLWTLLAGIAAVGILVQIAGIWVEGLYQDTTIPMATLVPIVAGSAAAAWLVDGRHVRSSDDDRG